MRLVGCDLNSGNPIVQFGQWWARGAGAGREGSSHCPAVSLPPCVPSAQWVWVTALARCGAQTVGTGSLSDLMPKSR